VLTVTDVNYIRQEVNLKGRSYSEVAKQMGNDFRTIKKYADQEDWNEPRQIQRRKARVMEAVKPIIDQWLMDDSKKKKKFQRTAKRMFDQLEKEHNFQGSYRAVRDYVSRRKKELGEAAEAALPLEAKPGTAQVDFGEAPFIHNGEVIDLPYLVLSFPYSNTFYF
jgi:transposase